MRNEGHPLAADNLICTWSPKRDTCNGDSGGPLVMESGPKKALVLVGILSLGPKTCASKHFPTLFTDVRKEADWIHKTIEKLEGRTEVKNTFDSDAEDRIIVSDTVNLKLNLTILAIVMIFHFLAESFL